MAKIRCRGFIAAAFSLAAAPRASRLLTLRSNSWQHSRAERRIRRLISYLPCLHSDIIATARDSGISALKSSFRPRRALLATRFHQPFHASLLLRQVNCDTRYVSKSAVRVSAQVPIYSLVSSRFTIFFDSRPI
jgi:hypothetical protein